MTTRTTASIIAVATAAGVLSLAGTANAKSATFMEADVHLGMATSPYTDVGPALAWGAMIGVGGKLKRFPVRFYLMGGILHQGYDERGTMSMTGEDFHLHQNLLDLSLGLRIVIPIIKGLRAYVDLMGLGSWQKSDLLRGETIDKESKVWVGGGLAALGLQYRWHKHASTGVRLEWTIYGKVGSTLPAAAGLDARANGKLVLAVVQSWYF